MALIWVLLCSALLRLVLCSGPDVCSIQEVSSSQSMLLQSLRCHNDYESHVYCSWRKHRNTSLELWFDTEDGRKQCEPLRAADGSRTVHCRYETPLLFIGAKHSGFFLENTTQNICSPVRRTPLDVFQHVRALPPANLSTHEAGDGGWRILWSSPYPSSSNLSRNLSYQLSFRSHRQDSWTSVENITSSSVKLEKHLLLPGRRYEARVRVRAAISHWSFWSPLVAWKTGHDSGQPPALHCVLEADRKVLCSWEVSRDQNDFISYQLFCRRNQTSRPELCCKNPSVGSDHSRDLLIFSCSLDAAEPELLLDLQPSHSSKTFEVHQHIRPKPPEQLKVREDNRNWKVEWMKPSTASQLRLSYQVCFYRTADQGSVELLNISGGSMSATILEKSLESFQTYQVKVRSVLVPGHGSHYEGVPSEWTDPVDWTSHGASWSSSTFIYVLISVLVSSFFFILYCSVPACQRKLVLWVDSVPSPGKSKILSEMKSSTTGTFMQSEKTSVCRVQQQDSVSTCSSEALLWPTRTRESDGVDQEETCWDGGAAEKVQDSDTSSMSFSGPYIFCQSSEQTSKSVNVSSEDREAPSVSASPSSVNFTVFGDGYVHLPSSSVSRSTQDLVSCSSDSRNSEQNSEPTELKPDGLIRDQPAEFRSGSSSCWPQSDAVQTSGYLHLPTSSIHSS